MANGLALSWEEYVGHDATALASLVDAGEVAPDELAMQAREAVDRVNSTLNAVIEVFDDEISAVVQEGPSGAAPFYGVPMMLKDLGSRMRGRVQESGYAWRDCCVADEDDPLTSNFRRAGFSLIGRTTTPEDGMSAVTESLKFGITRNPWNPAYSSGGSSGGSSAIVAAGGIPVASASDGAGSIRIPAACTGLIGLKSSRGRLPLPLGVSEALMPSAVEGVLTRSVRDTARILDCASERPLGAGFMPYPRTPDLHSQLEAAPRKLRIALSTGNWSRRDSVPRECVERTRDVALWLQGLGHSVEEVTDDSICEFKRLSASFRLANWIIPLGKTIPAVAKEMGVSLSAKNCSNQVLQIIEAARPFGYEDYAAAQSESAAVSRQWGMFWEQGYDLLLTPCLGDLCPAINSEKYALSSALPYEELFDHTMDLCRYTMPANDTGLPAISLPAGTDANGLPMAIQFYAPWTMEHQLIHIAGQLEAGRPEWFHRLGACNVVTP